MLNVVLVELSYREKRVLRVVLLADAAGITTEHARLLPFLAKVRALTSLAQPKSMTTNYE